ncbi:MAG: DUF7146 domain-containing protein [Sulfuricaulis sp.]
MNALEREKAITKELLQNLRNRWDTVLPAILPELADAVKAGCKKHVTCPYHKGKHDFRIGNDFAETGACFCTCMPDGGIANGIGMIMFARRVPFMEAKRMLIEYLGGRFTATHIPVKYTSAHDPQEVERKDVQLRRKITRYWEEAKPLDHPQAQPARNWLRARGLGQVRLPIPNLRCHPGMVYMDGTAKIGEFPAMLGMVRNHDGKTCTIHRTFLSADGSAKAPLPDGMDVRKNYPAPSSHPINGAAIRLDVAEHPVLSVGEGIETMLSVQLIAPDWPVWSALNKQLLTQVEVPDYVRAVIVWADRDRSQAGASAAIELVDRLRGAGLRAVAFMPPFTIPDDCKGVDWNDVIRAQGIEATANNLRVLALKRRVNQILKDLGYAQQRRAAS